MRAIAACLLWVLLICTAAAQSLRPGDCIRLSSPVEAELNGDFAMNSDGAVWLPGKVSIQVGSDSISSLRNAIKSALRRAGFDIADLTIGLGEKRSTRISITGAVEDPGFVNFRKGLTLSDLARIARPSVGANLDAIRITDASGAVTTHQLEQNLKALNGPIPIRPGDDVFFPLLETSLDITVLGEVENPGKIEYFRGITALQAIGFAGGMTGNAKSTAIEVVRGGQVVGRANAVLNQDAGIARGDLIRVPIIENPKYIFVAGAVMKPGRFAYIPGMRFTEAINQAQGIDPKFPLFDAFLVRRVNGVLKRMKCDLDKMVKRTEPNRILEPGDAIEIVPRIPKGNPASR